MKNDNNLIKPIGIVPNIDYVMAMSKGLEGIVKDILNNIKNHQEVECNNITPPSSSDNSILITFRIDRDDVVIPEEFKKNAEINSIKLFSFYLDRWFKDLDVNDEYFSVSILFNDVWKKIVVPYSSLVNIKDDKNKFNLKLEPYQKAEKENINE